MRQRGAVWRGLWTIACVFLCAYIAFDVLDLDSSQLHLRSGVALTSDSASAEADRALRSRPIPLTVRLQSSTLASHAILPSRPAATAVRPRHGERLLPRRHLPCSARSTPSADPV